MSGSRENGGEQVVDRGLLALDGTGGDRQTLLMGVVGLGLRPGGDEGHAHAALVVRALLATQRGGAGHLVLMSQRRIGTVVAEEEDERVLRDAQRIEMIEDVAERLVHAFDQGGESLGGCGLAGVLVVGGETRIGVEGRMHGVVREVEEEGLAGLHRIGDARLGLDGQRLGQKRLGAVVFLQVRNGVGRPLLTVAVVLRAVVAAGRPDRTTGDVDVEAEVLRLGTLQTRAVQSGPCRRGSCDSRLLAATAATSRRLASSPSSSTPADRRDRGCPCRD